MPELPEVETVVRDLRAMRLVGTEIAGARVYWRPTLSGMSPAEFDRRLRGQAVLGVARRAKYIVVALSGGDTLLIHLRMTGQLSFASVGTPRERHQHLVLALRDGRELRYRDTRKFGRWQLLADPARVLGRLGPEPLDRGFRLRDFEERMDGRHGMLKPLLLNQSFIAGLGNIYVDEALWRAGLHPRRRSETLVAAQRRGLYLAIRHVLRSGVASMGTTLGKGSTNFYSVAGRRGRNQDRLKVFRRVGEPCPRCRRPIERIMVGQRSTHICTQCQPEE